jgi:hypothetical protein
MKYKRKLLVVAMFISTLSLYGCSTTKQTTTNTSGKVTYTNAKEIALSYYKSETNKDGTIDTDKTEISTYQTHESTGDANTNYNAQVYKIYFTDGSTVYISTASGNVYYSSIRTDSSTEEQTESTQEVESESQSESEQSIETESQSEKEDEKAIEDVPSASDKMIGKTKAEEIAVKHHGSTSIIDSGATKLELVKHLVSDGKYHITYCYKIEFLEVGHPVIYVDAYSGEIITSIKESE